MSAMLNNAEAAARIGCTPKTLNFWRSKGKGPRFVKFGSHRNAGVRYDPAEIDAWKAQQTYGSTTEYSAAALASTSARNNHMPPRGAVVRPWEKTTV